MKLKDIVSQLANRINQPHVIEVYLRQVYAKGFVDGTRKSPWISVEERLPETDDDLYIALDTEMNPPGCDVCEFNPKTKTWIDSKGYVVHPTHWHEIFKIK